MITEKDYDRCTTREALGYAIFVVNAAYLVSPTNNTEDMSVLGGEKFCVRPWKRLEMLDDRADP
jgi:hypothetical protein